MPTIPVPIPVPWRVISLYRKEPRHYGRVFNLKASRIAFEIRFPAHHCPSRAFYFRLFSRLLRPPSRLLNSRTFVKEMAGLCRDASVADSTIAAGERDGCHGSPQSFDRRPL